MLSGGRWRTVAGTFLLVVLAATARATITVGSWTRIYHGIEHATGAADSGEPRLQVVNAMRIDLDASGIAFYTTPSNGGDPEETTGQTASNYLTSSGVEVAINANFFDPALPPPFGSDYKDLDGLAISQGNLVSDQDTDPGHNRGQVLLITQGNSAWFDSTINNPISLAGIYNAVCGDARLLVNGGVSVAPGGEAHPRTVVGISQDGNYIIMVVVDGRQSGYSEGATLEEAAQWLIRFGAYNGIALDGGGSTTMVRSDGGGGATVLNSPVGAGWLGDQAGERENGNHIGVFSPAVPIFTADFEDAETNPGNGNGSPYPAAQPEDIADGEYGWEVKSHGYTSGAATIVDTGARMNSNAVKVVNKRFRTDLLGHSLVANSIYEFKLWFKLTSDLDDGGDKTIWLDIGLKDQTSDVMLTSYQGNVTVPAYDTWYSRTVSWDSTGYSPATFDLRIISAFSGAEGEGAYTDDWSVIALPNSTVVTYWQPGTTNNPFDRTEWEDTDNWDNGVPNSNDQVIIHSNIPFPIIDEDDDAYPDDSANIVNILTPSWHDGVWSAIRITDGGYLEALSYMRLSNGTNAASWIDMTGGTLTTPVLEVYYDNGSGYGGGFVNLDNGTLNVGALSFDASATSADGNIDLDAGALLILDGDLTETGTQDVPSWVSAGLLSAADGGDDLDWDYSVTNLGKTTVWSVAAGLARSGGFNVPSIAQASAERRQIRSAIAVMPLDLNHVSDSWQYATQCGVASAGNVYLAGLSPDANGRGTNPQAAILFDNGGAGNAGQIWQDITGMWDHQRTYTVSWSEGAAYVNNPGNITRYADLTVSLVEILNSGLNPAGTHDISTTEEIWTASMVAKGVRFVADLKTDDGDPNNDVIGYRLQFDARNLQGMGGAGDFGFVVFDSASIEPGWLLGDMDCDGDLDNFDIDPFVLALTNPTQYALDYPDCDVMNADCDNDGDVDNFDIDPFVALLTG